jgi:hypothetical protein
MIDPELLQGLFRSSSVLKSHLDSKIVYDARSLVYFNFMTNIETQTPKLPFHSRRPLTDVVSRTTNVMIYHHVGEYSDFLPRP